jgi:acyl-CoA dehydrogenase
VSTANRHSTTESLLFNPHTYNPSRFDDENRRLLRATID